ncbi:MAG: hypothetical protein AB7G13_06400 [Lautropia sp.]
MLLDGMRIATIRHGSGADLASQARSLGLEWPARPGAITGQDPYLVWRDPQEVISVGTSTSSAAAHASTTFLAGLAPGARTDAVAVDLSEAVRVFELPGPCIDDWLERLVDASAVPRLAGTATRCRFADIAVLLLRLAPQRLWLLADRALEAYVKDWLDYSRRGLH